MASIRKRRLPRTGDVVWLVDYKDQLGKRRSRQFPTRKEADSFLVQARHEVASGVHTPDSVSVTIAEAAGLWIARCEANEREATTIKQYRSHVDHHISPGLGTERLSRLTTPKVEAFADELQATLSRPLARKVLVSLKSLLRDAQRRGLIAHNPALPVRIDAPARHEEQVQIPTKAELQGMLQKAAGRWRPLIVTAMLTGLRASELRGLTWPLVDLEARVIRVRQRADAYNVIGSPKSRAGRRDVPMSPMVANVLREWKLACPKGGLGLVFPNTKGGMLHAPDILRQCWLPLLKACGLVDVGPGLDEAGEPVFDELGQQVKIERPRYTFHQPRHAAASLLIEQGALPKRIQEIMGHSSIKVTFDIYGHLFADAEADQALVSAAERSLGLGRSE